MPLKYIFYPDVFWITNFTMDALVLMLVSLIQKSQHTWYRIPLSAALGTSASLFLFLNMKSYLLYTLVILIVINPCMVFIAFPIKNKKGFWKHFISCNIMMLLFGGVLQWLLNTFGGWDTFGLWVLASFGISFLIIHWNENRKIDTGKYEILLSIGERKVTLQGFLDTGNLLKDPTTGYPVHIISKRFLQEELDTGQILIRYIPYQSLGNQQGLIPIVTLKNMYLRSLCQRNCSPVYLEKPVFGIAEDTLFLGKEYQVLLNESILSE